MRIAPSLDGRTLGSESNDFVVAAGAYEKMREQVGAEGGSGSLLTLFAKVAESEAVPAKEEQA